MPLSGIDAVLQVKPFSPVQVSAPTLGDIGNNELKTPVSALPPESTEINDDLPSAAVESVPLADPGLIPFGEPSRYFLAHELDVRPQIMTRTEPDFPASALEKSISTAIQTRLYIDENGRVERVVVPEGEDSDLFAPSIVKAFLAAGYSPGIKDGKPVKSLIILEIRFETAIVPEVFRGNRY